MIKEGIIIRDLFCAILVILIKTLKNIKNIKMFSKSFSLFTCYFYVQEREINNSEIKTGKMLGKETDLASFSAKICTDTMP